MQKKAVISVVLLLFCLIAADRMAVLLIKREAAQNDYWIANQLEIFEIDWDAGHFKSCAIRTDYRFYKSQNCFIRYTPNSSRVSYVYTPPAPIMFRRDGFLGLPAFGTESEKSVRFTTPFRHNVSFSISKNGDIYRATIIASETNGEPANIERILIGKINSRGSITYNDNE